MGKAFLSALLKYHWQIQSVYILGMQHDIHCEIIATIKYPSPHIVTFGCVCVCVCVWVYVVGICMVCVLGGECVCGEHVCVFMCGENT